MPPTSPARTSSTSGFTLIEVLVASVVAALAVAAAASSLQVSRMTADAAGFHRKALLIAEKAQAAEIGIPDCLPVNGDIAGIEQEEEYLNPNDEDVVVWKRYVLRSTESGRRAEFALQAWTEEE